jgi:zinc/manganese transport system substrate-binding protein
MRSSKKIWPYAILIIVLVVIALMVVTSKKPSTALSNGKVNVVAAENFWGSLVSQIGGNKVNVLSIVSDPNADPHEYESSSKDARSVAQANYVIINGAGYDSWASKLISAGPSKSRKVLDVATLLGKKNGDNPHLWYSPTYVNKTVLQMERDLISIDPSASSYFKANYKTLTASLFGYQNRINQIKKQFAGTKVAATEDIFTYLAQAAGLNLISPPSFIQAVAEGNDPPANSVAQFQQQLESGQVKVLVYNLQTVTPLTNTIKQLAAQQNIPVIGVTETIQPPNISFQDWMKAELINLENALNSKTLGN